MAPLIKGNGLSLEILAAFPPLSGLLFGAETVGEFAARSAIGLGANVKDFLIIQLLNYAASQDQFNKLYILLTIQPKKKLYWKR